MASTVGRLYSGISIRGKLNGKFKSAGVAECVGGASGSSASLLLQPAMNTTAAITGRMICKRCRISSFDLDGENIVSVFFDLLLLFLIAHHAVVDFAQIECVGISEPILNFHLHRQVESAVGDFEVYRHMHLKIVVVSVQGSRVEIVMIEILAERVFSFEFHVVVSTPHGNGPLHRGFRKVDER